MRQLRRFIQLDCASIVGGVAFCLGMYVGVIRSAWVLVLAAIVTVTGVIVASAWRPANAGRYEQAATLLCVGNWVAAVGVTAIATFDAPVMVLTALMPAVFAIPYVTRRRLAVFMAITVACVFAIGLESRLQDVSGLTARTPRLTVNLGIIGSLPLLAGLILVLVGQNWTALQEASRQSAETAAQLQRAHRELASQAEQLSASRARLVRVADGERHRIERDLHDGAQQHLVALALKVRLARQLAADGSEKCAVVLDELAAQLQDAIGEIRNLAQGIYPPVLISNGLGAALPAAATRAGLPVTVELVDLGRYHPDVEAAVYFCCLEALNNAAKHGGSGVTANVTARAAGSSLTITITDTGVGFDPDLVEHGTGLTNMADRLAVHRGVLSVRSQLGSGTVVEARLRELALVRPPATSARR